jgi:hypothetical protein
LPAEHAHLEVIDGAPGGGADLVEGEQEPAEQGERNGDRGHRGHRHQAVALQVHQGLTQ